MCNRPIKQDGNTFACRTCNECIATRRHNWVARAMMEKATNPHALVIALTYDETTQENRDAAKIFQYLDVRRFFARLREAIKSAKKPQGIRFLVAGEQGSRGTQRCHWHMVIYSNTDLTQIGEVQRLIGGKRVVVTDREKMITLHGGTEIRLNWSLWPKGFVTFQEPDQGGMNYVLSYVLKDQFTEEKSKGTMRQHKAENFATGIFRPSKRPAIGERWFYDLFAGLEAKNAVLPNLNIKVPGFHGYYHPSGSFREKALWALVALNQRIVWATGRNAPQWPSLLASCRDNPPDLEILTGVKIEKEETFEEFEARILGRSAQDRPALAEFRRRCGGVYPCKRCCDELHRSSIQSLGIEQRYDGQAWQWVETSTARPLEDYQAVSGGDINPFCLERGSLMAREAYPFSKNHDA